MALIDKIALTLHLKLYKRLDLGRLGTVVFDVKLLASKVMGLELELEIWGVDGWRLGDLGARFGGWGVGRPWIWTHSFLRRRGATARTAAAENPKADEDE